MTATTTAAPPTRGADHSVASPTPFPADAADLRQRFDSVRAFTESLASPLELEDYVIQSMPDVSPAKWHLAHTSWFFERFVLFELVPAYRFPHPQYDYLFNSYYNTVGPQHCRPQRGLLSRPTVEQVYEYRRYIDGRVRRLIESADDDLLRKLIQRITIGLHHEQQHQELMLTDIKHVFSTNPLLPTYAHDPGLRCAQPSASEHSTSAHHTPKPRAARNEAPDPAERPAPPRWTSYPGGVHEIGSDGDGFHFDHEGPRHRVLLEPFALADRPVTNAEFLAFVDDGGYERHELWLSMGWATVKEQGWRMPFYWYRDAERWMQFTLNGPRPLAMDEPVCHLSYFEADAFARWTGARLPTEAEWEVAAASQPVLGNLADSGRFHPAPIDAADDATDAGPLRQCFGDVWEWTASAYAAYPGYRPLPGALGEYNGKFMCNQYVLRGGSCATPPGHIRPTYRNFFPPDARWQITGLRLARSA